MSSVKADQIRNELEQIRRAHRGTLTKAAVVQFARSHRRSVLHSMFDWRINHAANQHWLERAGEIIARYVVVQIVHRSQSVLAPYYVRDPGKATAEPGYIATSDRLDRGQATKIVLAELERVIANIERARNVALAMDAQHDGLSQMFERMLMEAVTMRDRLAA